MNEAYSPYKALRHLDVIHAVRACAPARPVHVQVILSDLCNQACSFCAYRDPDYTSSQLFRVLEPGTKGLRKAGLEEFNFNPNRMIPYEKVIEILDDCREMGTEAIQFTGGGEPTVHPRFEEIIEATIARGLKFSLVTNGVNVAKKGYAKLLGAASWVRVSLDAGKPDTYARVRNVPESQFDDALSSIAQLRDAGCETVGVGFVVTPDNWSEVAIATRAAFVMGAHNIRISAQFSTTGQALFAGFLDECAALCREAEEQSDDYFVVFNRFEQTVANLAAPDYDRCGYQQFTTYIGADLNVYRCCVLAYNEAGIVGSLKERRFRDLWMSQARADAMGSFEARGCERCQFNGINRVLDYAIRPDEPMHKEFV